VGQYLWHFLCRPRVVAFLARRRRKNRDDHDINPNP
jgi:hypothetical protein